MKRIFGVMVIVGLLVAFSGNSLAGGKKHPKPERANSGPGKKRGKARATKVHDMNAEKKEAQQKEHHEEPINEPPTNDAAE